MTRLTPNSVAESSPQSPDVPPPENILQDQIHAVWEPLLGRDNVRVTEDFFALGGTPEGCEQMLTMIEHLCGVRLQTDDVAGGLTIRNLGETLVSRVPPTPIVEVQKGSPNMPPFFYLHGDVGGGGYYVHELARGLGTGHTVYAVHPHGLCSTELPPSIEAMAMDGVRRLREIHASGPLYLGGHCFDALVALEMARQLSQDGDEVVSLLLVDPIVTPGGHVDAPRPAVSPPAPEQMAQPRMRAGWIFEQRRARLARYRLPSYDGRMAVLWARDRKRLRPTLDQPEARALLQRLAPRVEMYVCPGTHISALGRHVRFLASTMRRCIRSHGSERDGRTAMTRVP
jgi:pimeloyl-ACP methyl ester carboxylesterase